MDQFPKGTGGFSTQDDFDLLSLGIIPDEEEPAPAEDAEGEGEPRINPIHDMDSVEFLLWVEEGARQEIARRKAKEAKAKDEKPAP